MPDIINLNGINKNYNKINEVKNDTTTIKNDTTTIKNDTQYLVNTAISSPTTDSIADKINNIETETSNKVYTTTHIKKFKVGDTKASVTQLTPSAPNNMYIFGIGFANDDTSGSPGVVSWFIKISSSGVEVARLSGMVTLYDSTGYAYSSFPTPFKVLAGEEIGVYTSAYDSAQSFDVIVYYYDGDL